MCQQLSREFPFAGNHLPFTRKNHFHHIYSTYLDRDLCILYYLFINSNLDFNRNMELIKSKNISDVRIHIPQWNRILKKTLKNRRWFFDGDDLNNEKCLYLNYNYKLGHDLSTSTWACTLYMYWMFFQFFHRSICERRQWLLDLHFAYANFNSIFFVLLNYYLFESWLSLVDSTIQQPYSRPACSGKWIIHIPWTMDLVRWRYWDLFVDFSCCTKYSFTLLLTLKCLDVHFSGSFLRITCDHIRSVSHIHWFRLCDHPYCNA